MGRLRLLCAPVDFHMGGSQPAIYGTVDLALAITRYKEWHPASMFESHPCAKLRFSQTSTSSQATDGVWNRLVLSALPIDRRLKAACIDMFRQVHIQEAIFPSAKFCDRRADDHRSTPLGAEYLDGCGDPAHQRILLPRFFPIPERGDIPAE